MAIWQANTVISLWQKVADFTWVNLSNVESGTISNFYPVISIQWAEEGNVCLIRCCPCVAALVIDTQSPDKSQQAQQVGGSGSWHLARIQSCCLKLTSATVSDHPALKIQFDILGNALVQFHTRLSEETDKYTIWYCCLCVVPGTS